MWSHERQAKILELLGRDGKVLTNHLAELLAVGALRLDDQQRLHDV